MVPVGREEATRKCACFPILTRSFFFEGMDPTRRSPGAPLITLFHQLHPSTFDRDGPATGPTSSEALGHHSVQNELTTGGSSPGDVPSWKNAGRRGKRDPMMVGSGYTSWELCDGQSLASPGRCA